jgi:GntR family transcriptional regulator, transcriptional repressor for pyruvate dehydrogenase complex
MSPTAKITRLDALALPIGRQSVPEMVVQRILATIKSGQLSAGDKLPTERDLAAQLDVSRPTVREALRALSILGVLEIRHGGGVFVTALEAAEMLAPLDFFVSLNVQNMAELFDARIQYEPMITGLAAERLTDDALTRLASLVAAQIADPESAELFHDTDVEFHKLILEASGNAFLSRIGKLFQMLGDQGRKALQRRKSSRLQSIEDHQAIMVALAARDPAAAHKAMRQHMINVRNALREVSGA